MAVTIHLLVIDRVLIVIVRLQRELRAAYRALEATRMKERKVLEGSNPVHLVHRLLAAQTRALVEVRSVHLADVVRSTVTRREDCQLLVYNYVF